MLTRAEKARLKQLIDDGVALTHDDLASLSSSAVDGKIGPGTISDADSSDSQERLRLVLEASSDGFWDYDVASGQFFFSARMAEMLGYTPAEIPSDIHFWDALIHPDDRQQAAQAMREHFEQRTPGYRVELRLKTKRGEWIWVVDHGQTVKWSAEGKPLRIVGTHTEITERKLAEESLRLSEQRYRDLIERSQLPIVVLQDFRAVFANLALGHLLGYADFDDLRTVKLLDAIDPADHELVTEYYDALMRGEMQKPGTELRLRAKDGHSISVEVAAELQDYEGRPAVQLSLYDVSKRKQTEELLKQSEEQYRSTLDSLADPLHVIDRSFNVVFANRALLQWLSHFGFEIDFVNKNLQDTCSFLPQSVWDEYRLVFETGNTIISEETTQINQSTITTESRKFPVYEGSRVSRVITVMHDITERKRAERHLRLAMFSIEQASDAVFWVDCEGHFRNVNEAACKGYGYSRDEFLGMVVGDVEPGVTIEDWASRWEVRKQEKSLTLEAYHRHKNGMLFPVEISASYIEFEGKDYLCSFIRDVSERKRGEEALRRSEEFLRAVLDSSPLGISVRSASGRLIAYNTAWQKIWAMPDVDIEDDLTRDRRDLILDDRDDYAQPWWAEIRRVYREGGTLFVPEARTTGRREASAEWVSQHFYAILDQAGKVDRVVVITQDITQRKRAEDALRAKTEELDRFFSLAIDLLCIADVDGNFLRLSTAWEKTLGYKLEDLEGHRFLDFVHPEDLADTVAAVSSLAQGQAVLDFVNRYRCKDGSYRWIEWRSMPFERKLIYAAARDVTERRQAEAERQKLEARLSQAQKMEAIGTLAGGIAHDFNNVLFAILGNAEIIQEELTPGTALYENMSHLIAAGNRAKGLVKQILTFSRKSQREVVSINIEEVIKEVVKLMRATLPSTIEVKQRFDVSGICVLADPTEIHQVVMNLCMNAAQAMEERPGLIEVSLSALEVDAEFAARHLGLKPGPHVQLRISDTGHGMSLEVKGRIFEPFFTTKGSGQGTGMGLAVVHGIVAKLGGAINVYSELERGSTFNVFLPTAQATETPASVSPRSLPTGAERVLLVDDEPEILSVTSQILRNLGYEVRTCQSSEDALALFTQDPQYYDVVVTDQTMPKLTGVELAKQMFALRPEMPVILCSGYSPAVTLESAADLGIREYLYKPVLRRDLAEALRRALQKM
jgi:PAS domain S-box-containing protein